MRDGLDRAVLHFGSMVASAETARGLVEKALSLANELETLAADLHKAGAILDVRHFMQLHSEGNPHFDILDAAKAIRSYAGVLSVLAAPKAKEAPQKPRRRNGPKLPVARPEATPA